MLFGESDYFNHLFPYPQYLGAKHKFLGWIHKFMPKKVEIVLDAFAGSQSVAYFFKQLGLKVYTNDFLNFNHQIGLALVENKREFLTEEDIALLFQENKNENFILIQSVYTNVFFDTTQAKWLDNCRANIEKLPTRYKKALAFAVINRSLTRKVTMGHFGHLRALNYANNPERIKRNPSLIKPIKDIFLELLPKYNQAIFDNKKENLSFNENILDLMPKLSSLDLVYFDPPYCDSHADYQSFYHLLETYVEYWRDKQFINTTRRYEPQRFSGFDKKGEILVSFEKLFTYAQDIPHWLISYNNRSYPNIDELTQLIKRYKDVQIEAKTYVSSRGGKGSVTGSQEILFICKNKPLFIMNAAMKNKFSFDYWQQRYESDNLEEFSFNSHGLLWLKIKSIARRKLLDEFLTTSGHLVEHTSLNEQCVALYDLLNHDLETAHQQLNDFIGEESKKQCQSFDVEKLVSELYKLRYFDWGGDYKNALDKYLVDKYVKVYQNYDELVSKFDTEISRAVQGYVLCSWYNHWSSILIEQIFKSHPLVLPTVGQIKKVDFFLNDIPFDLKVTYLPANFIDKKRKERGLKSELAELKYEAKQFGLQFNKSARTADIYYEIVEKMQDKGDILCKQVLADLKKVRTSILNEARQNPKPLIQNLYEEQGEMRFDASNRLFLVLADTEDFDNSWKLKRNLNLLTPAVQDYLNNFPEKVLDDLKITFHYKNRPQTFTVWSDIIFVVK